MPVIHAVVFDIGNVLVSWSLENLYRSVIPDPAARAQFLDQVLTAELNQQVDDGRGIDDAITELSLAHPHHRDWILAFRDRWIETMGPVIDGSVELLSELRARGIPVYALTNFGAEAWPIAQQAYPPLSWFDGEIVSSREGISKPDPRIYRLLTDRYELEPGSVFFTDDNVRNVQGAIAAGWQAVQFTSPEQLRADLRTAGVL